MFSSCSLSEKETTPGDDNSLSSTDKINPGSFESYDSCTVNMSIEKLETVFLGKEFVYQGSVIPKDSGVDFDKIKNTFVDQKENGNLFPVVPSVLELQFSDSIPQSVTWYGIYMSDGNIAYPSLSIPKPLENIDVNTILPIGINLTPLLDADLTPKEYYRIIRIVCEYDDRIVEYNIFFNCVKVKDCLP